MQGIHDVRWLSRGQAVERLCEVLPAVIVLLQEYDTAIYHVVTSLKFHVYLFFLADVLAELNNLNLVFQRREVDLTGVQSLVRRTLIFMRERYIDCGSKFGAGTSKRLSPFLKRLSSSRTVKVEGVDSDGSTRKHSFDLHEELLKGYSKKPGDLETCINTCRSYAVAVVDHLQERFKDLDSLDGAKLFMPDSWPKDTDGRKKECAAHLEALFKMFHIGERREVLPGEWCFRQAHHLRMLASTDWRVSCM
ncbi:unnamed protein product [Closterium sp. Naga37s-1]|nr:unnamed protein product [Closterium sp. Naga37s-1]